MVRLSLLAVIVVCLMGQIECDSSSRDRDEQNRETKMLKPMLNELSNIKGILEEIKDLGTLAATMQLSQTQPEETQVAECPVCGKYKTCNQTTFECELKAECGSAAKLDIVGTTITTTYTGSYVEEDTGDMLLIIDLSKGTAADNYIQFNFTDMNIVKAFLVKGFDYDPMAFGCIFSNFTIETSEDCVKFTQTLTRDENQSCPGANIVLPEPVLAQCVRIYPTERQGIADTEIYYDIYGCIAQI